MNTVHSHEYWLTKLDGEFCKTKFCYDFINQKVEINKTESLSFVISGDEWQFINKVANNSEQNLYVILVAYLNVLINKYMMDTDIIVGAPINKQKVEGEFVNTILPLRNYIQDNMTFKQLIMAVKQTFVEANKYMNYPIEIIPEELGISSENGRFELFDIAILLSNLQDKNYITHTNPSILFEFTKQEESLVCTIEYDANIYKKESVEGISTHFAYLLNSAKSNINMTIEEIPVVLEGELELLIDKTVTCNKEVIEDESIIYRFERMVKTYPKHIAVVSEGKSLTYEELDLRANQLARLLSQKGAGKGKIIGLMMEQSMEVIVGILGILKSGSAYLPIDSNTSKERLDFIINDSEMLLLLIKEKVLSNIDVEIETLDINSSNVLEQSTEAVQVNINNSDLAYVIYTSGTTGKAKGVLVEHRNLLNYVNWFTEETSVTEKDKAILVSSYCFDLGYTSIYTALLNGGELHVAPRYIYSNAEELLQYIADNKISYMKLTPSLFATIVGSSQFKEEMNCETLRLIVIGGERLHIGDVKEYFKKYPTVEMINHYGPTETTIGAIFKRIDEEYLQDAEGNYVIGKTINNTKAYILNKAQKCVPIGAIGEICIAGAGLSRGYLNRDELTKEQFTQNPYEEIYEKIYHTGDLGRLLPNGNIAFIGRKDDQVKVRGYRVELGEIEHHLLTHEAIKEVVVMCHQTVKKDNKLCAYFVAEHKIKTNDLREFSANSLPDYMVPSYYIQMDVMPLTANGKVNKRKLPMPKIEELMETEYVLPENELEKELANIWRDALGLDKIGTNSNFYEIGGDSLNATMIVSKVYKILQVKIFINDLFKYPSIRQLANYIKSLSKEDFIKIDKVEEKEYYAVSPSQKRMYMLRELGANEITYNTAKAISIQGMIDKQRIQDIFQELVDRHESLRTTFHIVGGEIVQKIHESMSIDVKFINDFEGDIRNRLSEFVQPFDLSKLPLLRTYVFTIKEDEHILFFDLPHIISDGISTGILLKEFMYLYQNKKLEPLSIQYKDYAAWQNKLMQDEQYKESASYWKNRLGGELPNMSLPYDYARNQKISWHGKTAVFELDDETFSKLRQVAQEQNSTLFMVLFTGYCLLLHKYTQGEDIIVGTPIAGRTHDDLQNIVGVFINTLAIRNNINGNQTIREVLNNVRETMLEAYEHQDYQFEQLVEDLEISVTQNRNPIFDTMFVMEDFNSIELNVDKLKFNVIDFDNEIARVDLLLMAIEMENHLKFNVEYCDELFEESTIQLIINHYKEILGQMGELELKVNEFSLSGNISQVEEVDNLEVLEFDI